MFDVPEIPEIGLAFAALGNIKALRWLGEGPSDSRPGSKAEVTYFGWWRAGPHDLMSQGTKSGLEWAQLITNNNGRSLNICSPQATRQSLPAARPVYARYTKPNAWASQLV